MIWRWLLASIIGLIAVLPLAHALPTLPNQPTIWQVCALTCLAIVIANSLIYKNVDKHVAKRFAKGRRNFLSVIIAGINFFVVMMASVSFGLAQYFSYQNSLLIEPLTVTATIRSPQISNTINLLDHTTKGQTLVGTGYQRQVWQIIDIKPFVDETVSSDSPSENNAHSGGESLNQKLPLTILATANLNKNPDWLPIINNLSPNQTLFVKLALEPIISPKPIENPYFKQLSLGFDEALWLRQRGIQAKAQVIEIYPNNKSPAPLNAKTDALHTLQLNAEQIRWQLRQKMVSFLQDAVRGQSEKSAATIQSTAILLSLLTGDSGLLTTETKHLYQVTGISHLLAISGPHVMMLASVMAFLLVALVKGVFPTLLFRVPAQLLLLWTSVAVSLLYALLVGFELPAQRTVWMLLLVTANVQWLLPMSGYRVLAWVGLAMLWLDTTAVLQAGFWLSFVAVGLLLRFSQTIETQGIIQDHPAVLQNSLSNIWQGFKQLLLLQVWLFILMMPVVVWFFGKIAPVSVAVNLLAVPFLGLCIVPLDMLAGVLSFIPLIGKVLSETIWQLLIRLLNIFHWLLQNIAELGFARQLYVGLSNAQLLLLGIIGVILLLPKRLVPKLLALPLVLAVIAISYQAKNTRQTPQLIVLDDTRLSVNLWVNGDKSWLILADNRPANANKIPQETKVNVTNTKLETDILENKIYPLMAKYNITQLAGVISQTPSNETNVLIQQLANAIPVHAYWLAGFNPLKTDSSQNFSHISPQNCQVGKTSDTGEIEAITGWQLNNNQLNEPLDDNNAWHTHTCLIRVQSPQKSAIIMAGDSELPMRMSHVLCTVSPVDILISPAMTPFTVEWLADSKPSQVHLITSRYSIASEDSQFAITGYAEDSQHSTIQSLAKSAVSVQSNEVGTVVYGF